jgi:hypothetical protein
MKTNKKILLLLFPLLIIGCSPQKQYHDFSTVEWVPITEVFQEAYSIEWENFDNRITTFVPLSSTEFSSLTDGNQDNIEFESSYYMSNSQGLRFQVPAESFNRLYISDLKIRVIYSHYHSQADLNDGAIKVASWISDNHHQYERDYPFKQFRGQDIDVCTSNSTTCNPFGNGDLLMKDYEINFHQYRKDEDGTYDWNIDTLFIKITGLSLGFYYIKLDEIYVKVVSDIVMP